MKKSLALILRLLISAFFLGLLWWMVRGDLPQIADILRGADHARMALATLIFLATVFVLAWRLRLIFEADDVPMRMRESVQLTFVGYFFNNFLPTSVGGDVVKALCAARVTGQGMKSVTSVLMDRILGLFTFVLIPALSLLFYMKEIKTRAVPVIVYTLLALAIVFFFLIFNRTVARRFRFVEGLLSRIGMGAKIRRIYEGLHNFRNHKPTVAHALLLSVIGQSAAIYVLYLCAGALGSTAQPIYFFLLVPVVNLMSMLPSINGLGIREGAYVYFLTPVVGKPIAASLGIYWLSLLILLSVIGGLVYLARADYHIRWKEVSGQGESA